jgi:hypothetical protein
MAHLKGSQYYWSLRKLKVNSLRRANWLREYQHFKKLIYSDTVKKVKVKFTPEQATKAQMGSRGIALLFL